MRRTPWMLGAMLMCACSTPAVGAPCLPEQVPEGGFDDHEAYIESSSLQCETRVCMVFRLRGDPREACQEDPGCQGDDCVRCADPDAVNKHVFCTCRCDAGDTGLAECECPDGFRCAEVLEQGNAGVRGGYCTRNEIFTD